MARTGMQHLAPRSDNYIKYIYIQLKILFINFYRPMLLISPYFS